MTTHYPRIRIHAESSHLLIRDSLRLTFYMRRDHTESAPAALNALEIYLSSLGNHALEMYSDEEGDWQKLNAPGTDYFRREIRANQRLIFHLSDSSITEQRYQFDYHGKIFDTHSLSVNPDAMSTVAFWLPTEYLEEKGPIRVHELAIELATSLPFCSGQAGLSFNCDTSLLGVTQKVRSLCFRYPGMDIPESGYGSRSIGSRLRGPSWMTFLGPPVLEALGGVETLRAQLRSPGTTVKPLGSERAVITLGEWPEAGDMENGQTLPAYRELARVIEPWLYHRRPLQDAYFPPDEWRRWERRFLDEGT